MNVRNIKDVSWTCLQMWMNFTKEGRIKNFQGILDSCIGITPKSKRIKRWVIDVDNVTPEKLRIIKYILTGIDEYVRIDEVPTVSGVHLITSPFNLANFIDACFMNKELMKGVEELEVPKVISEITDVKKDSFTLLYYKKDENLSE